jgi:hypothetical protein
MNKLIDFKLFNVYYDFMNYTYNLLRKYPLCERYFLIGDIKSKMNEILELLIKINNEYDNYKKNGYLKYVLINYNVLLVYFRLSYKQKFITKSNYSAVTRKIAALNNVTLGVIKSCKA